MHNFIVKGEGIARDCNGRIIRDTFGNPEPATWRYLGNMKRGEAEEYRQKAFGRDVFPQRERRQYATFELKRDALAFVMKSNRSFAQRMRDEFSEARKTTTPDKMRENARDYLAYQVNKLREHLADRHNEYEPKARHARRCALGCISRIRQVRLAQKWLDEKGY